MNHLRPPRRAPASWEALSLVGHHLDPKTLAMASCVSKSWRCCFSSDHLWQPLCSAYFPSLASIRRQAAAEVPCRRIYAAGHTAAKRRLSRPAKPALPLQSLVFVLAIDGPKGRRQTVVKPCGSLEVDPHGLFRFEVDVADDEAWTEDELEGVRVTWHVVLEGWKGVFTVMECGGRGGGRLPSGADGWLSEELPPPGCCSGGVASGIVGDLRLGVRSSSGGRGGVKVAAVEKVTVGVLSIVDWRYVTVDYALGYLQHFLCEM